MLRYVIDRPGLMFYREGEKGLITVEVVLFATLRKYNPHGVSADPFQMELPKGTKVEDLLKELKIPPSESKQVFINSKRQEFDYELKDGERVAIFPPIAGG